MNAEQAKTLSKETRRNRIVEIFGMRPLTTSEMWGYQGIEGDLHEARIAELDIDGIDAQMVIDERSLQLHLYGPDEGLMSYAWEVDSRSSNDRRARELMAAHTLQVAETGITFDWLIEMGWERIC